ncbi:hypothetical protein ACHAXM_012176 [Skeletonema potamos]|jgi:hypothetical protein
MVGAEAKRNKKKPQSDEINNVDETSLTCRVSDLAAELNEHVFQGRIFDARVTALKLKSMRNEVSDSSARSKIDCVQHIIEETLDQAEHVDSLLHELHSDDGWTLAKEGKNVVIHYRREPGTSIHTVRAQTEFHNFEPKDFTKLLSLFVETECMPKWFPGGVMKKADVLSWQSKYSKVIQLQIKLDLLPFLSSRDAILYGNGFHLPAHNAFLIRSKSTQEDTCRYCDIPKPAKGVVRMDTESIFFVQLLQKDVISFKMIGRDDLKLKYVPSPLLNYISQGHLPYDLMRNVRRTILNFEGSVWDKKMKERVSYYKEIENKVYAQLEKWEKDGSNALDRLSYGEKAPKKPAPAKSSMSKVLSAAAVLVAITTSLLYAYRSVSLLNDTVTSKKIVMTLFGNDRFRRIILSTPTLIMSTASIRKITKLLSTDNTKS